MCIRKMLCHPLSFLKCGMILFWACWFSVAFSSNIFDFLKSLNIMPNDWLFVSHNYSLVAGALSIYHAPEWLAKCIFIGILLFEGVIAVLFWLGFFTHNRSNKWAHVAFTVSAALWAIFLVSEEVLIAYQFESGHLLLFISQIICLLALHFLPSVEIE